MEECGIKRYVKDFGIEFKNGSWITVVTPNPECICGKRYESVLFSAECADILREFSIIETGRPSPYWKTVAPSWCEELNVYNISDLGEMDTADVSVLFG